MYWTSIILEVIICPYFKRKITFKAMNSLEIFYLHLSKYFFYEDRYIKKYSKIVGKLCEDRSYTFLNAVYSPY